MDINFEVEKYLGKKETDIDYYSIKSGIFHVSEISYCPRFIYLSRTEPIESNLETKKYFLIGNLFHDFFEKEILKEYSCEQKIEYDLGELKIIGKADAYNETEVIDLKTCKDTKYIYAPKEGDIIQLNIYMKILGLKDGRLIYIGKNDLSIKDFKIKFNEKLFEESIKKIRFIQDKLNKKADYKEISIEPSSKCYYCKYIRRCFKKQY